MYISCQERSSWFVKIMKFIGIACLLGAIFITSACAGRNGNGTADDRLAGLSPEEKAMVTREWAVIQRLITRRASSPRQVTLKSE